MLLERAAKSAHSLLKPKREKEASELPSPDRCFVWGSRLHKVYDTNSDGVLSRDEFRHLYGLLQGVVPSMSSAPRDIEVAYRDALGEEHDGGLDEMSLAFFLESVLAEASLFHAHAFTHPVHTHHDPAPSPSLQTSREEFDVVVHHLMEGASQRAYQARGETIRETSPHPTNKEAVSEAERPGPKGEAGTHEPDASAHEPDPAIVSRQEDKTRVEPPSLVVLPTSTEAPLQPQELKLLTLNFGAGDSPSVLYGQSEGNVLPSASGKRSLLSQRISRLANTSAATEPAKRSLLGRRVAAVASPN